MEAGACSCNMRGPTADMVDHKWPKARFAHYCDECHKTIVKGEVYWRGAFVGNGRWYHTSRCRACYQIGVDYCCKALGAGDVWRNIWEMFGLNLRPGDDREDPKEHGVL